MRCSKCGGINLDIGNHGFIYCYNCRQFVSGQQEDIRPYQLTKITELQELNIEIEAYEQLVDLLKKKTKIICESITNVAKSF